MRPVARRQWQGEAKGHRDRVSTEHSHLPVVMKVDVREPMRVPVRGSRRSVDHDRPCREVVETAPLRE
jgi:hypothetical protein